MGGGSGGDTDGRDSLEVLAAATVGDDGADRSGSGRSWKWLCGSCNKFVLVIDLIGIEERAQGAAAAAGGGRGGHQNFTAFRNSRSGVQRLRLRGGGRTEGEEGGGGDQSGDVSQRGQRLWQRRWWVSIQIPLFSYDRHGELWEEGVIDLQGFRVQ
jgi:hypothetical protein